jgi:hypothetical protein
MAPRRDEAALLLMLLMLLLPFALSAPLPSLVVLPLLGSVAPPRLMAFSLKSEANASSSPPPLLSFRPTAPLVVDLSFTQLRESPSAATGRASGHSDLLAALSSGERGTPNLFAAFSARVSRVLDSINCVVMLL